MAVSKAVVVGLARRAYNLYKQLIKPRAFRDRHKAKLT